MTRNKSRQIGSFKVKLRCRPTGLWVVPESPHQHIRTRHRFCRAGVEVRSASGKVFTPAVRQLEKQQQVAQATGRGSRGTGSGSAADIDIAGPGGGGAPSASKGLITAGCIVAGARAAGARAAGTAAYAAEYAGAGAVA